MRLMRPAVSSTAAWLPGTAILHSSCMTLPLLQPTSACTFLLVERVLLSNTSLREPAQCCPRQSCPLVGFILKLVPTLKSYACATPSTEIRCMLDKAVNGRPKAGMGRSRREIPDCAPLAGTVLPWTLYRHMGAEGAPCGCDAGA